MQALKGMSFARWQFVGRGACRIFALAVLATVTLFGNVKITAAAETGSLPGPFNTRIDVWESGCHTIVNAAFAAKEIYITEPQVRNANSLSFDSIRLNVWIYSRASNTSVWKYEPSLSYSRTAKKSTIAGTNQVVVNFSYGHRSINLQFRGSISVLERLDYLKNGVTVGNPVQFEPSLYTYLYAYPTVNLRAPETCQF